jgi:hypothetical protein
MPFFDLHSMPQPPPIIPGSTCNIVMVFSGLPESRAGDKMPGRDYFHNILNYNLLYLKGKYTFLSYYIYSKTNKY